MGFCESFAKIILIILNVLFFIIGAVILGVGIWVKVDKSNLFEVIRKIKLDDLTASFDNTNSTILDVVAIVLIIFGAFTFVTGFCGCCGAIKEHKCLLITYSILVAIVVIVEIAIGIYAGIEKNKFQNKLGVSLKKVLEKDFNGVLNNNATMFTKIFTAIMFELKCCGVNNVTDFNSVQNDWKTTIDNRKQIYPVGCCKLKEKYQYDPQKNFNYEETKKKFEQENCPFNGNEIEINTNGCIPSLISLIEKNMGIVIGICVGLGLFEIMCIVFACCVIRRE